MTRYVVRRIALAALILWVVSVAVFVLLRVAGGDPVVIQQGMNATPERIAQVHKELHLDEPYYQQYARWVQGMLKLDLGHSSISGRSVVDEAGERVPVSFQLMVMTVTWTILLGIPFGVVSALKRNSAPDYVVRVYAVFGLSVPAFWIATLVLMIPAQRWGYAPPLNETTSVFSEPWANIRQFGPPSLVLSLASTASIMRLTRSQMLEVLRSDYVRTARAKGLEERVVVIRHALRNSLVPVITVLGLQVSGLLGGSVIIESIFNLRGLGQYIYAAILQKDFAVAQTLVMFTASAAVLSTLTIDLLYVFLDPRIRYT